MRKIKDYVVLSYITREDIKEGLRITDEEVEASIQNLKDLNLITEDEEGRIYDLENNFYRATTQWQNL